MGKNGIILQILSDVIWKGISGGLNPDSELD